MMHRLQTLACVLLSAMAGRAQHPAALQVKEVKLANGMTVWLNEDHSQPKVYGAVVVKAGGKDCPDTGIAHYFEHIMFKGTDSIGTVDYAAEKVYLDSIAAQYELLAQTADEARRKAIQQEINRLSIRAGEYAIPNEFDRLIAEFGGTGLNAGTSYDYTYYYNTFAPQYIRQWLTLNSHRLIHPVYRLFQGELETVYEEKNRAADNIMMGALEHGMAELFKGTPYEYPIIGSTDNLKNPQMSEMEAFYRKYYVAGNMGLILCGDFDTSEVTALLEPTFGRLPRGSVEHSGMQTVPPLSGQRTVSLKVPLPLLKMSALAFRAPTDIEKDAPALDLAASLLANEGETGLIDSLANSHKLMGGIVERMSLNGIAALIMGSAPNLPFGSKKKAEQLCWQQVQKLKRGQFSDHELEVLKMEKQREQSMAIESLDGRAAVMVEVFSQGRSWDDYLRQVESIGRLTKQDVVDAANRYFTDDYVRFVKKFGMYKKDVIEKPDFQPVRPKHADAESDYAHRLRQMAADDRPVRLIDFEKDADIVPIIGGGNTQPSVRLFATKNPANDIFDLTLLYHRGTLADPSLDAVATFAQQLGTDSLTLQQLKKAFQGLGATFTMGVSKNVFAISLTGFDRNLGPSLRLLAHFMTRAKADAKAHKEMVTEMKAAQKGVFKSNETVMEAIMEKVEYGQQSEFLNQLTVSELKSIGSDELLRRFLDVQRYACDIIYSGQLPTETVAQTVRECLPLEQATQPNDFTVRPLQTYDEPLVYVYDMPSARQTIIRTYHGLRTMPSATDQSKLLLTGRYFGGGMSSLMFQEIREFRSLAYSTGAAAMLPACADRRPSGFTTYIGTQADKTMQSLAVLDTLLTDLPLRERNLEVAKKEVVSSISNGFPTFRTIGTIIAAQMLEGLSSDPNANYVGTVPQLQSADVVDFFNKEIKPAKRVTVVIGNKKKLDLQQLARYGRVIELKPADFFRM